MFIATPVALLVILYINYDQIINNQCTDFARRYSSLISEFDQNRGFKCMLYYPIYTLRRVVYAISQVYLSDYPVLQKSSHLVFGSLTFLYLIIIRPYKEKLALISNCVSEGLLCLIFVQVLIMHFNPETFSEDSLNLFFISILMSCLGFQYIISLIIIGSQIKEIFKKFINKKKASDKALFPVT